MVGFSILNQSARESVLAPARRKNVGTLCMFAVRAALSQPPKLREVVRELVDSGRIDRSSIDDIEDPLGFLTHGGVANSVPEAAYRFCRDEPGMHVILSGTGNLDHLEQNVAALKAPPLPQALRERLMEMFAGVDSVSGN
jgi:aryl-alcohol dehydrogenase-like predicted oxidoreductase